MAKAFWRGREGLGTLLIRLPNQKPQLIYVTPFLFKILNAIQNDKEYGTQVVLHFLGLFCFVTA